MFNLNSVSKADADLLRAFDKADKNTDNQITLKGLSQEDKTKLRETLVRIEKTAELSPEDKVSLKFALKSLNGESGGSYGLDLKETDNSLKTVSGSASVSAARTSEPLISVGVSVISEEQVADIIRQKQLAKEFKKGHVMLYSQNFGLMDSPHIRHNALSFIDVYKTALKAAETGKEQEMTIQYGKKEFTYTIKARQGDDLLKIAREVSADVSYRYEDSTSYLGGMVNKAAEVFGRGGSAFSTEDLASNALGFHAAEQYIKNLTSNPNNPEPEVKEKVNGIGKPPNTNVAGEAAADWVEDWALAHAGKLYTESEAQVERTSHGNSRAFYPVHSQADGMKKPVDTELEFFRRINGESLERGGHMSGKGNGWAYDD